MKLTNEDAEAVFAFHTADAKTFFTIRPNGTIEIGAAMSTDEATQLVAKMLADNYSALHREQAVEIARLLALLDVPA